MTSPVFDTVRAGGESGVTAKALYAIEKECFADPWSVRSFQVALEAPYGVFFALVTPEKLVSGYAGMYCIADEGQITNVAVLPQFRQKGGAAMLLARLTEEAVSRGLKKLTLEVRESNAPARHLYEKNGFYSVGRRKNYYTHPTEDAILMDKDLTELC